MVDLWHFVLAWFLGILQKINNIHREFGLWTLIDNWKAILCAVILLLLGGFGGRHLYAKFTRDRLLKNAHTSLEKGDAHSAAVFGGRLLQKNPDDLEACKVMAAATARSWPAANLYWHSEIDRLQPHDTKNCLEWAEEALSANSIPTVRKALAKVPIADTKLGEYEWLEGQVALSQNAVDEAAAHFEKAVAASPDKMEYAFDLAKTRLMMPGKNRVVGRQELEAITSDPARRLAALRLLFRDAMRHLQAPRAFGYFAQLRKDPGVSTEDRMQYLDFLLHLRDRTFTAELAAYEKTVRTPGEVASLAFWMNTNSMSLVAVEWIIGLSPALQSDTRVQLALAEAYVSLGDWPRLKALVMNKDWKDLDFLRVALLARCLAEQGDNLQSKDQWNLAVLKAADNPDALARLCETAIAWGWNWETEAEDLAWRIVDGPHPSEAILDAMETRFLERGDTLKLYRLLARRLALEPSNRSVINNFALVSLLLKKNEDQARELAQKAYQEAPDDARSGSTYALSLYLQGQTSQALDIMSHYGEQLREPSVALYNGIFLAAGGEPGPARRYLKIARLQQLLPEEEKLAEKAEASIGDSEPAALVSGTAR